MQHTTNYNLNLPEGTDIVNPLTDYNPNFTDIDTQMKANADRSVGRATCVKSGTNHAVTRSNTDSNIINFTATGDWDTGDTMTIDSVSVSVFMPDGSAALTGAYVINSEVFGILNGTRFTLYSNIQDVPAMTATNTSYDNTNSGLTATNVQDAIDEVMSNVNTVESKYSKNTFGSSVALNNNIPWPATYDGYVTFGCGATSGEYCNFLVNDVIIGRTSNATNLAVIPQSGFMVRKGMVLKLTGTTSAFATFYPFV